MNRLLKLSRWFVGVLFIFSGLVKANDPLGLSYKMQEFFEAMCHELHIAGWTATQGNRSSISSEVVTTDQMGGSIKKAQVGHVIISVAKTLQQKELKLATIAITKSRIGKDGVIFENCKFDNELLVIDTESSMTFLGFEENKEQKNRDRIREIMEKKKQQTV